jgi:hypothetical protein
MPIYTSEYIKKVMDFYTVSIANDGDRWLVDGMDNLKTLRINSVDATIDFTKSKTVLSKRTINNQTYISMDDAKKHKFVILNSANDKNEAYLISSNAKIEKYIRGVKSKSFYFNGYTDLKLSFNLPDGCSITSTPKISSTKRRSNKTFVYFKNTKKAVVNVQCR